MEKKKFVSIMMGSESDLPVMQETQAILNELGVHVEMRIYSAHRTPAEVKEYVQDAELRNCQIFIAGAGLAAHLAGAIASHSIRPTIGVPLESGGLGGMDALLSTVQMPAGIPVATVAIGKAGAKNAAWLTAQILALSDDNLAMKIKQKREETRQSMIEKNRRMEMDSTVTKKSL